MRIALLLVGMCLVGCRSAAQPAPASGGAGVVDLRPRVLGDFERVEARLGSEVVRSDTTIPESPPLRLGPIYRRPDPELPGVPLTVAYATQRRPPSDSVVHVTYVWGGGVWPEVASGLPGWSRQPPERLGAFDDRYEAVRTLIAEALGAPAESSALSCAPCTLSPFGAAIWKRFDMWESEEIQVSMALEFGVPLIARPRVGYAQRIQVRVYHLPPVRRPQNPPR